LLKGGTLQKLCAFGTLSFATQGYVPRNGAAWFDPRTGKLLP